MGKKATWMVGALLGLAATFAAFDSEAQRGWGRGRGYGYGYGGGGQGCGLDMWAISDLGLSQKQMARVEQLRSQWWNNSQGLRNELSARFGELQALWRAQAVNEKAVLEKERQIDILQQRLDELTAQTHAAFLRILTPTQRQRYTENVGVGTQPGSAPGLGRSYGRGYGYWGRRGGWGRGRGYGRGCGRGYGGW